MTNRNKITLESEILEMLDDVDWQSVANSKARIKKDGTPELKSAHITDQVPFGGHYRYKTNANMTGNWLIGGELKVNKILSSAEVKAINDKAGVADLPKLSDLGKLELLTKPRAPTPKAPKAPKPESPASGVKIEPPTKDKDGIIAYTGSKNKDIVEFRLDRHRTWGKLVWLWYICDSTSSCRGIWNEKRGSYL